MQLKSLIRFPIDVRRARRLLDESSRAETSPCTGRPIALDLRTNQLLFDCGRHLASLAYHAHAAGSPFYVRGSSLLLSSIARKIHGREMLADPHAQWISAHDPLPEGALVLCDDEPTPGSDDIGMLIGRDIDRDLPVMPYPMHPATLRQLENVNLGLLRESTRAGILFAGNQKPKYGHAKMQRHFGVLSRLEILGTLSESFSSRLAPLSRLGSRDDSIVISDNRTEPIDASDWLPTLARARFFVCCPGASQPTCHNLVEAMSVGTVPIIEYGDRVTPPLRDGENAICFRGLAGLHDAIERIDRMQPNQLDALSRNAANFYDRNLCGTRFMRALRDGDLDLSSRRICMPFHERNFYLSSQLSAA